MKKLSILFIIVIVCASSVVKAESPDYVVSNEDVSFYEKVRYGLTSGLVGVSESGKVRYKSDDVVAYRKGGKLFERMPVIVDNNETGRYRFMEVVAYRNGLKLYKHEFISGAGLSDIEFLVYQDGKYIVRADKRNRETLNKFFFSDDLHASNL